MEQALQPARRSSWWWSRPALLRALPAPTPTPRPSGPSSTFFSTLPAVVATAALSLLVTAAPPASASGAAVDTADARAWLARIQAAAGGNYQGTLVFSVGSGAISSTRVGHYSAGGQTFEMLESLDGRQQRVLRHNDAVHTLWPQSRLVIIESRQTLAQWSRGVPQTVEPRALERYVFKNEGTDRVAGREALTILLEPRDDLRYAQRLWADHATGLMLRADVIDQRAKERPVLESTGFTDVAVGVPPQGDAVLQAIRGLARLEGWRVLKPRSEPTTLEREGYDVPKPPAGFVLAGCIRRSMQTTGDEQTVLQAVFTDGLTHVSLFIEPFKPQHHRTEMVAQQGAMATLMARRGDVWITAVGDVPARTLKRFADAVERRRP
jgi:sigma-E factor negative regulatory protein RseB